MDSVGLGGAWESAPLSCLPTPMPCPWTTRWEARPWEDFEPCFQETHMAPSLCTRDQGQTQPHGGKQDPAPADPGDGFQSWAWCCNRGPQRLPWGPRRYVSAPGRESAQRIQRQAERERRPYFVAFACGGCPRRSLQRRQPRSVSCPFRGFQRSQIGCGQELEERRYL